MTIRQAKLQDKQEVMETANLLYLPIQNFIWNKEEFVQKQIENGEYFLAQENGMTIGIISLRQRSNKISIETLVVKKEFQGKGIGTQFIEFAKQFAKEREFNILHAYSFQEYNMADFYLKRGFRMLKDPGNYYDHTYYCFEMKV
jgi:N-acetylglutamate synthase-like GNAT family acetyltransferase